MGKDDLYFIVSTILAIFALFGMDWKLVKGRLTLPQLNRRSVLFLCLILGSISLSAVGWYKSHHRNAQEVDSLTAKNADLEKSNKDLAAKLAATPQCPQSASSKAVGSGKTQHQDGHHNIQQSGNNNQANPVTVKGNQTTNGDGSPIINGNGNSVSGKP